MGIIIGLKKEFTFDAAHTLTWHGGKCSNLHGHTYRLIVGVTGEKDKDGIIMDFGDLKRIVKEEILDVHDHSCLNDAFENPTAEIMAEAFLQRLNAIDNRITHVELYETPTSSAIAAIE